MIVSVPATNGNPSGTGTNTSNNNNGGCINNAAATEPAGTTTSRARSDAPEENCGINWLEFLLESPPFRDLISF
jgi:hypothetical protein